MNEQSTYNTISLIQSEFFPVTTMERSGSYNWKITDKALIKRIINSKNGDKLLSDYSIS